MIHTISAVNGRYALQRFQQFGLRRLIVTPLDLTARVTEPFVDRYLHDVKDSATSHSQLYGMNE